MIRRDEITVKSFFDHYAQALELRVMCGQQGMGRKIREASVNRPGLAVAGFTRYFAFRRVQVFGNAECDFLKGVSPDERARRYEQLFAHKVPCAVFCRGLRPDREFRDVAARKGVPVLSSQLITMKFINQATLALDYLSAPRGTVIGCMVDILGIGVIIRGQSGVGKSECVLALIERGYSLVADDVTYVRVMDGKEIIGTCSKMTRHLMEVRGIGIINVAAMFGIKSIREEKQVDLVVNLVHFKPDDEMDRLGLEEKYTEVLGLQIPEITIPVLPGRDIARLVEVAAFSSKLRASGFNSAKELDNRLIATMSAGAQATRSSAP